MELSELAQYGGVGVALGAIGLAAVLSVLAYRSTAGLQDILRNHLEHDARSKEAIADALNALHVSLERLHSWLQLMVGRGAKD